MSKRNPFGTDRDENDWQWGSTTWTSPQQDWRWPPIAVFDRDPYEVIVHDSSQIEVGSGIDPTSRLQLFKHVRLQFDPLGIPEAVVTYRLVNRSKDERRVAIWENTRVNWRGCTEFPSGGIVRAGKGQLPVLVEHEANLMRIVFDERQLGTRRLFYYPPRDGAFTWKRYCVDGLVLTKTRQLPDHVAPGQAPLEIILSSQGGFAELENQGGYATIGPGLELTMKVTWQLAPDGFATDEGKSKRPGDR